MIGATEAYHLWTPAQSGSPVLLNERFDDAGLQVFPRARVRRVNGIQNLADQEDNADTPVGRDGEIPRLSFRRGKTISYEGHIEAQSLKEYEQFAADLRESFYDERAEGRMDVYWHPNLSDGSVGAMPTFVAVGAITSSTGTFAGFAFPAGIEEGDLLMLIVESNGTDPSISGTEWQAVTQTPQEASGSELRAWYKFYEPSDAVPVVNNPANHVHGAVFAFRGVRRSEPFNAGAGTIENVVDTSCSIPGATTTVDDCLVLLAVCTGSDISSTTEIGSFTNAGLANITERLDNWTTTGDGGGLGIATGERAAAGAYGATTATLVTAANKALLSVALAPDQPGDLDGSPPVFYEARALGLDIGDPVEAAMLYRGPFVLALRNHNGQYYDAEETISSVSLTSTATTYDFPEGVV